MGWNGLLKQVAIPLLGCGFGVTWPPAWARFLNLEYIHLFRHYHRANCKYKGGEQSWAISRVTYSLPRYQSLYEGAIDQVTYSTSVADCSWYHKLRQSHRGCHHFNLRWFVAWRWQPLTNSTSRRLDPRCDRWLAECWFEACSSTTAAQFESTRLEMDADQLHVCIGLGHESCYE